MWSWKSIWSVLDVMDDKRKCGILDVMLLKIVFSYTERIVVRTCVKF